MSVHNKDTFMEELGKELQELTKAQNIRFAWLCAVRVLPFLCSDEGFNYWGKNKQRNLGVTFRAYDVVFTANAAFASSSAAFAAAAYATTSTNYQEIILSDLEAVRNNRDPESIPAYDKLQSKWDRFFKALKAENCDYWVNVYTKLINKNFVPDIEEIKLRLEVPDAVQQEGAAAVAKHMESLEKQGKKTTKETRIILLGTKGVGKTSLSRKLRDTNAFMPRKSQSTPGVDTSILNLIPNEITRLWDFGGHVIAQAAHKCFLSAGCVYVLVIDGRTEQQKDIDNFRSWLSTVNTYSKNSAKVFIVLNETDKHYRKLPVIKLMEEFPGLVDSRRCHTFNIKKDKKALAEFKQALKEFIESNCVRTLPEGYFKVKEELERQFKSSDIDILSKSDVEKIVSGIEMNINTEDVLEYLNILGVALSYDNVEDIVLNPSWISNGIYTIINHLQNNGLFEIHKEDISKIFKGKESKTRSPHLLL